MVGRFAPLPRQGAASAVIAIALLGLGMLAPATAQSPPEAPEAPEPIHVNVESFVVPQVLHRDGANQLLGVARNEGSTPVRIFLTMTAQDPQNSLILHESNTTLLPDARTNVSLAWNTRNAVGSPFAGPVNLTFAVHTDRDLASHAVSVHRPVTVHDVRLSLVQGASGATMDPGSVWNGAIVVSVRNQGSAAESLRLIVKDVPAGWRFLLSDEDLALPIGSSQQVTIFVEAPDNAKADGQVRVRLAAQATDPQAPSNPDLSLLAPRIRASGALNLVVLDDGVAIRPGDLASVGIVVENHQNHKDTVSLSLEALPGNDLPVSVTPSGLVPLEAGEAQTFTVLVAVPTSAPAGSREWGVRALSQEGSDIESSSPMAVDVEHVRMAHLSIAADATQSAQPGQTFALPLRLSNTGNGADRYRIALESAPAGWTSDPSIVHEVPAGATIDLPWTATLTPGATAGPLNLRLRAYPDGLPSEASPVVTHPVVVAERPAAAITATAPTASVDNGGFAPLTFSLRNAGNAQATFRFSASVVDAAPNAAAWQVSGIGPRTLALAPGGTATQTVDVRAPATMTASDRLAIEASFAVDGQAGAATTLVTVLPKVPDLTADLARMSPDPAYAGQPLRVELDVKNQGGAVAAPFEVRVRFHQTTAAGTAGALLQQETIQVDTLDWRAGQNTLRISSSLQTNLLDVLVQVVTDAKGVVGEINETNNAASHRILLHQYRMDLTAPAARGVLPGQHVSLAADSAFQVRNDGSHTERVVIRVSSDRGWLATTTQTIDIAPGTTHRIEPSLRVPTMPLVKEGRIIVNVTNAISSNLTGQVSARLVVDDSQPPQIVRFGARDPVVTYGQGVRFEADLVDATGIRYANVTVYPKGAASTTIPMVASNGTFAADYAPLALGPHEAYITVRDNSEPGHVNSTLKTPVVFVVQPGAVAQVRAVSPAQGGFVKPGMPLVYAVSGGRPIESVTATSARGVHEATGRDVVQVDTKGWGDGLVLVNVTVRDVLGAKTSFLHDVHVDGTPAAIANVTMRASGTRVLLHADIQDASPIANVTARVEYEAAATVDVAMSLGADGYTAEVPAHDGVVRVTVIAKDAAGNVAVMESTSLRLAADSSHKAAPGTGSIVAIAAGAAVAVACLVSLGFVLARRRT